MRGYRERSRQHGRRPRATSATDGYGGAIHAGLFLQEFVGGRPWAHLDIAGVAFTERDLPCTPRGAVGFGVRLLTRYVLAAAGRSAAPADPSEDAPRARPNLSAAKPSRSEAQPAGSDTSRAAPRTRERGDDGAPRARDRRNASGRGAPKPPR